MSLPKTKTSQGISSRGEARFALNNRTRVTGFALDNISPSMRNLMRLPPRLGYSHLSDHLSTEKDHATP